MASTVLVKQLQSRAAWQVSQLARRTSHGIRSRSVWTKRQSSSSSSALQSASEGGSAKGGEVKLAEPGSAASPRSATAVRGGPVSWLSLGLLVATGAGLLTYYDLEKRQRIEVLKQGTVPTTGPSVGKAAIGGPFKLLNHEGKVVTDLDFVGNWTLVYFGFTFCPDICPAELTKLAKTVDNIEKQIGLKVVPVFISIDPERDTVDQVREYLKDYHPRLVGLTGSVNDIRQAAHQYRVYYMKTEDEGLDYLVDHSIIMYLMDPNMDFVKFFGKNFDAEALTAGVIEEIQKANKK